MGTRVNPFQKTASLLILGTIVVLLAGCGAANRTVRLEDGYTLKQGSRIQAGNATNVTGNTFEEIDIEKAFKEELDKSLVKNGLNGAGSDAGKSFLLPCKIVEYEQGNAFKRWLLPGWGATALSVQCDLREIPGERTVGSVEARRTVSAGGGYTIGAWKTIFTTVADDVSMEISSKIGK
jgi:hypothetical protein